MKKDKIITVRVNSILLEKVNIIINERTRKTEYYYKNKYTYISPNTGNCYDKVTVADILEIALKKFLENEIL